MADRRGRHPEFGCSLPEAQVARRGIKGAQLDEGWQLMHGASVDENGSSSAEFFAFAPSSAKTQNTGMDRT